MTDTTRHRLAQAALWGTAGFTVSAAATAWWHGGNLEAAGHLVLCSVMLTASWVVTCVGRWFDARIAKAQADRDLSVAAWEVMQRQLANGQQQVVSLDVPIARSAKWKN